MLNDIRIPWGNITDVIVMNQHSMGSGMHMTVASSRYTRQYLGYNTFGSQQIGDVMFMSGGAPVIIYRSIADPHGVAQLAKSLMRSQSNITAGMQSMFHN